MTIRTDITAMVTKGQLRDLEQNVVKIQYTAKIASQSCQRLENGQRINRKRRIEEAAKASQTFVISFTFTAPKIASQRHKRQGGAQYSILLKPRRRWLMNC